MPRCGLLLSRFTLPAWVGAAALFVVNGVGVIRSGNFDVLARDQLALIRFPAYYQIGFGLTVAGLIGLALARCSAQKTCSTTGELPVCPPRRCCFLKCCHPLTAALILNVAALAVMGADYLFVYRPLAAMITPPGTERTTEFHQKFDPLHGWSMKLNLLQILLVAGAGLIANAACEEKRV